MNIFSRRSFKIIVAVVLTAVLYLHIDAQSLLAIVTSAKLGYIALSVVIVFIVRLLMSERWRLILDNSGIPITFGESVYINLVSSSLGFLFPGGVGADIIKGQHAYKKNNDLSKITTVVLLDRFIGLMTMLLMVFVFSSILLGFSLGEEKVILQIVFLNSLVLLLVSSTSAYIFIKRGDLLKNKLKKIRVLKKLLTKLYCILDEMVLHKSLAIKVLIISIFMQLLRGVLFYYIFKSISVSIDVFYVLAYIPVVFIAMMLPFSIGGIGVRESALFVLFQQFSLSLEQSISSGILFYSTQIFMILPGLLLYAFVPQPQGKR